MSLNFCDVLIWGSDLSGIIAGTLLAKRGLNVLVLDDEAEFIRTPNLLTGLGSRAFKSLLSKLMIPESKLQSIQENDTSYQILLPKNRVDISVHRPLLMKEMNREFPEHQSLIEELFQEVDRLREAHLDEISSYLPFVGGLHDKEKNAFIKWFKEFPDEKLRDIWNRLPHEIKFFIESRIFFLTAVPLMEMNPPVLQLLYFLPPEVGSTYSIKNGGGERELKKVFFERLDYFGGMIHPLKNDTIHFIHKGQELRGLQLGRFSFPTRCRYVIGNLSIKSLYKDLPTPLLSLLNRTKKKVGELTPRGIRRVIQYHTEKAFLPEPLKENSVYVSDLQKPLEGVNYLEMNQTPLAKPKSDEIFDTLLTVSLFQTLSEYNEEAPPPALSEETLQCIDAKLEKLFPFIKGHIKRVFPAPLVSSTDTPELFPPSADETPEEVQWVYPSSIFFPTVSSPFKNMFVAGPNILDWLGMDGKILTATRVVELIWEAEQKLTNKDGKSRLFQKK